MEKRGTKENGKGENGNRERREEETEGGKKQEEEEAEGRMEAKSIKEKGQPTN